MPVQVAHMGGAARLISEKCVELFGSFAAFRIGMAAE
jgi:hypothetical protein